MLLFGRIISELNFDKNRDRLAQGVRLSVSFLRGYVFLFPFSGGTYFCFLSQGVLLSLSQGVRLSVSFLRGYVFLFPFSGGTYFWFLSKGVLLSLSRGLGLSVSFLRGSFSPFLS